VTADPQNPVAAITFNFPTEDQHNIYPVSYNPKSLALSGVCSGTAAVCTYSSTLSYYIGSRDHIVLMLGFPDSAFFPERAVHVAVSFTCLTSPVGIDRLGLGGITRTPIPNKNNKKQ
jgi:hypothetical protein